MVSCAQGPTPTTEFDRLEPVVSIRFDLAPAFGQLVQATLTITNTTVDPILLETIDLHGQLPFLAEGGISLSGELRYRSGGDFYLYDPRRAGETEPVFSADRILLPAESRDLHARIRIRFPRQPVNIAFRRIPLNDLLEEAYFPVEDPHDRGPLRWKRLTLSKLAGFRSAEPGSLDRTVLIPHRKFWRVKSVEKPLDIFIPDVALVDRELQSSGASNGSAITRWNAKGWWVIDDPKAAQTFAIDVEGLRQELPRCDLEVFDLLDGLAPGESLPVYQSGADEPSRRITAAQADSFLEGARTHGQTVRASWIGNGRGGYEYSLEIEEPAVETGF